MSVDAYVQGERDDVHADNMHGTRFHWRRSSHRCDESIPSSSGNTAAPKTKVAKQKKRVEARRNGTRRNIFFFILLTKTPSPILAKWCQNQIDCSLMHEESCEEARDRII
ncbi:uncharacterized protein LOC132175436 [Corylus avellana]|uniref:uncharacterized protein LOC132175436 n=1 Tax=Corylus avellana TaxID=13451 RepID=UPI00286CB8CD|nr:uncharacterized protein LOC132175436 [Corylus avellana]